MPRGGQFSTAVDIGGLPPKKCPVHEHGHQHDDKSREQAAGTTAPECRQIQAPCRLELKEQQRCDQEAGQHKEDIDAEKTAAHDGNATVVEHHRENRQGAQPVQCRAVRQSP